MKEIVKKCLLAADKFMPGQYRKVFIVWRVIATHEVFLNRHKLIVVNR